VDASLCLAIDDRLKYNPSFWIDLITIDATLHKMIPKELLKEATFKSEIERLVALDSAI
jgi:hypothetical protein